MSHRHKWQQIQSHFIKRSNRDGWQKQRATYYCAGCGSAKVETESFDYPSPGNHRLEKAFYKKDTR